jgi:hypothetical protein
MLKFSAANITNIMLNIQMSSVNSLQQPSFCLLGQQKQCIRPIIPMILEDLALALRSRV